MRVSILLSSLMLASSFCVGSAQPATLSQTVIRQVGPVALPTLVPVCPRLDCV